MKEISDICVINDPSTPFSGTCFQCLLYTDYSKLEDLLGPPIIMEDGYKTDVEWIIEFNDGAVATIYNWKDGKNYCGEEGLEPHEIKEWHIGGSGILASNRVRAMFSEEPWPVFDSIRIKAII